MYTDINSFFRNYISLTDDQLHPVTSQFLSRSLKKNEFLLEKGEICTNLVFVRKGCLRLYYIADDVEVSVWFAFQHTSAIEIHSFISGLPTNYYLQAIEDSEILYLPKSTLENLYGTYPHLQELMRKYWEDVVIHLINRFTALQRDSAEQRYLELLSKPQYMQTIPQKYLASFIGVTPTSLSRIRKNIR